LKAVGFKHHQVLFMILAESCVISLLGGALGLGAAWVLTLGGSPVPQFLPIFILPDRDIVIGAIAILVLGIVSGAMPAIQAMRLRISDALRREG
jgi:putative ABC transport system permease protein